MYSFRGRKRPDVPPPGMECSEEPPVDGFGFALEECNNGPITLVRVMLVVVRAVSASDDSEWVRSEYIEPV